MSNTDPFPNDSAIIAARAELAFNNPINMNYEIIANRDERCFDLYVGEDWYASFGSRFEAEAERDRLDREDDEANWQIQDRERNR